MKAAAFPEAHFTIPFEGQPSKARLILPDDAASLVILVHSRSSRLHPLHQRLARDLAQAGIATLSLDFLNEDERRSVHDRYDVDLHARRLLLARQCAQQRWADRLASVGYFASGSAAAAALQAAAMQPEGVGAVVCVQGRPDTAGCWLASVAAPTLLMVDESDDTLHASNAAACRQLNAAGEVSAVTDLQNEGQPEVRRRARRWFEHHLAGSVKVGHAAERSLVS